MAQSRHIINFNRQIEPNPFNTGPAIPKPSYYSNIIHSPLPLSGSLSLTPSFSDVRTVSGSPTSTASSTSLRLEDEEIKQIFSHTEHTFQQREIESYRKARASYFSSGIQKEDLNPLAALFVPSFNLGGNLKGGLATCTCSSESTVIAAGSIPSRISLSLKLPGPPVHQADPRYVRFLHDALKPSATHRDRTALVKLVAEDVAIWDMENLLDLAESLCDAACDPGPDFRKDGKPVSTCHFSRYLPVHGSLKGSHFSEVETHQKPENVAAVVAELHRQFLDSRGKETAQAFAWNVREIFLMQFIQSWDFVKPGSISYETAPAPRFVRSSLYLCICIAALFKQGIVAREHISMCISILLKDLMSIEHTEAVYNIIMGCGQSFWAPETPNSSEDSYSTDEVTQLNLHVHDFIKGLHSNFINNDLADAMSVVQQPWTEGQLVARLAEIVDTIREWEANLISGLRHC